MKNSAGHLFAIVDIETTGGLAKHEKITEIAVILHDGDKIIKQFHSLINPERSIPFHITRITGITNDMVKDAPKFYEIAHEIIDIMDGAIFVAHNVRFDFGFVKAEFEDLGYTFSKKQMCTVNLSRKAFPGLKSYALGNLIEHFGIEVSARHRALDDALATAIIFEKMYQGKLIKDIKQEVSLGIKEAKLPPNVTLEDIHRLPESCGIYYIYNENNDVIYVGKALNIKKRIIEHFRDQTEKARKLHFHTASFSYEACGSELVSLLLESVEIKRLSPSVNVAQRNKTYRFAVVLDHHKNGIAFLKVTKMEALGSMRFIKQFTRSEDANAFIQSILNRADLCACINKEGTTNQGCLTGQIGQCRYFELISLDPQEYNEALEQVLDQILQPNLPEDGIYLDKGRDSSEKAAIWVSKGICMGWGYLDKGNTFQNAETIIESLKQYKPHHELDQITRKYLNKHRQKFIFIPLNNGSIEA